MIAVSEPLAAAARRCGAREVRVIPNGIALPVQTSGEVEPAEILFAGRLSPEKGIHELWRPAVGSTSSSPGTGRSADLVPGALGFLSAAELSERYRRAAVVVCPSRSEGFGIVCAEAMAHGQAGRRDRGRRPAGARHGTREPASSWSPATPPPCASRSSSSSPTPALRRRLGENARADVAERFAWPAVTRATVEAYRAALGLETPEPAPLEAVA